MPIENLSGKVFCAKCFSGKMMFLRKRADEHGFFQCSNCRKIDEIAFVKDHAGQKALFLIPKEWDEVLDESVEGLIEQLRDSTQKLSTWRDQDPSTIARLQIVISAWKEIQHLNYLFPFKSPDQTAIDLPWQFTFIEADRELMASRAFAALGYYKDALKSLRSFVELCLFGLFIHSRSDKAFFQEWFSGKKQSPAVTGNGGLIDLLSRTRFLSAIDGKTQWSEQMRSSYGDLSRFVHSRGKETANLWLWQKAGPKFNEESWKDWIKTAVHIVQLVLVATICQFPRSLFPVSYFDKFGFDGPLGLYLDDEQVQVIRAALADTQFAVALRDTIEVSPDLQGEIASVEGLSSLTREEIDQTLDRFVRSVQKSPNRATQIQHVMDDVRLINAHTIRWSVLLNLQRAFVRETCVGLIAETLGLIKPGQE